MVDEHGGCLWLGLGPGEEPEEVGVRAGTEGDNLSCCCYCGSSSRLGLGEKELEEVVKHHGASCW